MNQEKFEQAYVESQAQIALVLAESLGLISEKRSTGRLGQTDSPPYSTKEIKKIRREIQQSGERYRNLSPEQVKAGREAFNAAHSENKPFNAAIEAQNKAQNAARGKRSNAQNAARGNRRKN